MIGSILFVCSIGLIAWEVSAQSQKLKGGTDINPLAFLGAGISNAISRTPIKGEAEGRTNFFVIGLDPDNGATDTMIIVSYFHKLKKVAAINIPRDFYVTETSNTGKINSIYPVYLFIIGPLLI